VNGQINPTLPEQRLDFLGKNAFAPDFGNGSVWTLSPRVSMVTISVSHPELLSMAATVFACHMARALFRDPILSFRINRHPEQMPLRANNHLLQFCFLA
jgi:hypothetical protein